VFVVLLQNTKSTLICLVTSDSNGVINLGDFRRNISCCYIQFKSEVSCHLEGFVICVVLFLICLLGSCNVGLFTLRKC